MASDVNLPEILILRSCFTQQRKYSVQPNLSRNSVKSLNMEQARNAIGSVLGHSGQHDTVSQPSHSENCLLTYC